MLKVGLTGAIASGKSEVEKLLRKKYLVVDLDIISHNILENEAKEEILKEFGTLNRAEIGKIVFNDKNKRKKLEKIIHPKLENYVLNLFEEKKDEKIVVISGALLYEAGFFPMFDKTIFVDAPTRTRLKRLQKRNSLTKKEALKRINSQKNIGKKKADFIIKNTGTLEDLKEQTQNVLSVIEVIESTKEEYLYDYYRFL